MTSIRSLAREIGVAPSTVLRRINRGYDPRAAISAQAGTPCPAKSNPKPLDPGDVAAIERGIEERRPVEHIADDLGMGKGAVYRIADRAGLTIRNGPAPPSPRTLREAVQDMPVMAALEYALEAFEQVAGQTAADLALGLSLGLTQSQASIFGLLHRNLGQPVAHERIGMVTTFEETPCPGTIRAQISNMRVKLAGSYTINSVWGFGYQMEAV
ncbi:hypothetical protein [Paracoccus hibiscisoli]|uniref:hypothetical protein n=1 Tax=Paracoccus hibiscisoli TaxID=2023261 RepID=UPI0023F3ECEB|nr:hypothetical protein [Paracoccus hibiscisoli]